MATERRTGRRVRTRNHGDYCRDAVASLVSDSSRATPTEVDRRGARAPVGPRRDLRCLAELLTASTPYVIADCLFDARLRRASPGERLARSARTLDRA